MKRLSTILLCSALLLAACGKDSGSDLGEISQKGTTLISADIESLLLGQDRRVWPEGAYIGVFGSSTGTNEKYILKQAGAGLASAEFYGPLVSGEIIAAYYPWSDSFAGRAEQMPASLSSEQVFADTTAVAAFEKYCPYAYGVIKNGRMKFFYPFGLLRVRVELFDNLKVTGMAFSSLTNAASGMGEILPDGSLRMASGSSGSVNLDCSPGVNTLRADGFTDFWITLVPGTYEKAVLVIYAEGEDPIVCTLNGLTVPRIDAASFALAAVSVHGGGPEGFLVQEEQFD